MNNHVNLSFEQNVALDAMRRGVNVFLTGKAGTGKSLVIKAFQSTNPKGLACLAPTGLAALNIQGETLHSFFRFPYGVVNINQYVNDMNNDLIAKFKATKTILIDEVSMARVDYFQAMDVALRHACSTDTPFGNKQIIVVGDFMQLPPVVGDMELEKYLKYHYHGVSAYHSSAWRDARFHCVDLSMVYRQSDIETLNALSQLRDGKTITSSFPINCFDYFNAKCYDPFREPNVNAITLTAYRRTADNINHRKLSELPGHECLFKAKISHDFPYDSYPTNPKLILKPNARVMMLANDTASGYFNGDLGTFIGVQPSNPNEVIVQLDRGHQVISRTFVWRSYEYQVQEDERGDLQLTQVITGEFYQLPIALGYAMTIHKAQGKTLDAVNIELGQGKCFSPGQLYTAMSRCRNVENIHLDRPICSDDWIIDQDALRFNECLNIIY